MRLLSSHLYKALAVLAVILPFLSPVVLATSEAYPVVDEGQTILASSILYSGIGDFGNPASLDIDSPVPVSILMYDASEFMMDSEPIRGNEVHVVVKQQGCTGYFYADKPVNASIKQGRNTIKIELDYEASLHPRLKPVGEFLDSLASFRASWSYRWFWCDPATDDCTWGGRKSEGASKGAAVETQKGATTRSGTDLSTKDKEKSQADQDSEGALPFAELGIPVSNSESASYSMRPHTATVLALLMGSLVYLGPTYRTQARLAVVFGVVILVLSLVGSSSYSFGSTDTDVQLSHRTLQRSVCSVAVDIMMDVCSQSAIIRAPNIQFAHVQYVNQTSLGCQSCIEEYEADLIFPTILTNRPSGVTSSLMQNDRARRQFVIPARECGYTIEGRPFVDEHGNQLKAEAHIPKDTGNEGSGWAESISGNSNTDLGLKDNANIKAQLEHLAQEWTRRALGEHSSIASFAAFTMALLTNQAPPDLVQDSLSAAMDEVNHAKVSFEVATMLQNAILGENNTSKLVVEPGPLPPSQHSFQNNMTALAIAAAQEGCRDETLSALVAACEAEMYFQMQAEKSGLSPIALSLAGKMRTIAMEEANHSILAWRTVHWACQTDPIACQAVREVLAVEHLAAVGKSRFAKLAGLESLQLRQCNLQLLEVHWEYIYKNLREVVTLDSSPELPDNCQMDDKDEQQRQWKPTESAIQLLAETIVKGVQCSISSRKEGVEQKSSLKS